MKSYGFIKLAGAAFVALALSVGSQASAATVINLGGSSSTASSFSYNVDGIGVTATGERKDGCFLTCYAPEDVSRASNGLGVRGGLLDSSELDGQIDERITFTFTDVVKLLSIAFSYIDSNDPYNVYVDTGSGLQLITANAMVNPFVFVPYLVGNKLQIAVDGNASAFRISSLTVSAVPVPAAGLMLLGALGGLAALRRGRKSA